MLGKLRLYRIIEYFQRRFLDYRTEWIGHQAFPSESNHNINITITEIPNDWATITAPCDGTFTLIAVSSRILIQNHTGSWNGATRAGTEGDYMGFTIPCSKGYTVAYQLASNTVISSIYCHFSPCFGTIPR